MYKSERLPVPTAILLVVLTSGCNEFSPDPSICTVKIVPETASLSAGSSVNLRGLARDCTGSDMASVSIRYLSSDTLIARVSSDGRVQGVRPGRAAVIAAAGAKSDTAEITVTAAVVP
jgi:uncharacterized protein YjdB